MPGPVGESNLYALHPRGEVLLLAHTEGGLIDQLIAVLAEGNSATIVTERLQLDLPATVAQRVTWLRTMPATSTFAAALVESRSGGDVDTLVSLAAMPGAIPLVQLGGDDGHYRPDWLVEEVSTSINTTAAGGNASLMALV
jgi:RHH-type proline utilization regulon transcriptional repressor/proline dehydrogenase/delta 1-pyrroline-5-carboxylate dehydrogenase